MFGHAAAVAMGRLAAHTTPTRCRRRLNLATAALQQLGLANLLVAPAAPARHIPRWRRSDNWCDGGRCDGGEWCSSGRRGGRRCSKRSGALTLLAAAAQSLQPVLLAFGLTLRELSLELVHLDEVGRARGRGRVCAGAEVSVWVLATRSSSRARRLCQLRTVSNLLFGKSSFC